MNGVKDHPGLYVAREPDHRLPLWDLTTAKRQPLARVERVWRGVVMDTYALEKLTGWTPTFAAAGFAAVPLARAGGRIAIRCSGFVARRQRAHDQ